MKITLALLCILWAGAAEAGTYWVSPTGAASWASCASATPLTGTAACALNTANHNAVAGDIVYLRGGTYTLNSLYDSAIHPVHSGTCASSPCTGGVGASRITFAAYTGEVPVLEQANSTNIMMGVDLNGVSWIRIVGITFKNFMYYAAFIRNGASYNEISYSAFVNETGYRDGSPFTVGDFSGVTWSVQNWIHHNYFSGRHNTDPCTEAVDMVRLGNNVSSPYSADNANTFEYNYVEYSGHANLVSNSLRNVIANNTFHNEPWLGPCAATWQKSTSVSSLTVGTGAHTLTTGTGLSYTVGDDVSIVSSASYANAMLGAITSYTSATGVLVVNVRATAGSGTFASWILSQENVPYYTNAAYNGLFGHRNVGLGDENPYANNDNVFEGNRVGHAGVNPGNAGSTNLDVSSPRNLVRYNAIYGGQNSGIYFKRARSYGAGTGGVSNYVYNNTIFSNGHGWNARVYGAQGNAYNGQGIAQYSADGGMTHNRVKNNIVTQNAEGDICDLGLHTACSAEAWDLLDRNWLTSTGDPLFTNPALTPTTSQSLFPAVHGYSSPALPDMRLRATSMAIDGGTHLTTAVGSGSLSTTLVVADAGYFQDGTRGSDLARGVTFFPDWIAIGSSANVVQISAVNYTSNTITLASARTWADGARLYLYKKSDGAFVLVGAAPDYGAAEYGAAPPAPPSAPIIKQPEG